MMSTLRLALATLALVPVGAVLAAVVDDETNPSTAATFYAESVRIGGGTARGFVTLKDGEPVELGVALSEGALTGLPANDHSLPGAMDVEGHTTFEHLVAFPANNPTPFRHMILNWNPSGHEPAKVYDTPHFDFHFYTIAEEERHAIMPSNPEYEAKVARHPSAEELPAGYVPTPPVPMMGTHWLDPKVPELNGGEFTQTLIAGTWDGRVTFLEPMVAKAYLESKPDFVGTIPEVKRHAEPGWHPKGYAVRWNEETREWLVTLREFERR